MRNTSDTIGNRTRDLPACSAVPQPTAPPRTPPELIQEIFFFFGNFFSTFEFSLKSDKFTDTFHADLRTFMSVLVALVA